MIIFRKDSQGYSFIIPKDVKTIPQFKKVLKIKRVLVLQTNDKLIKRKF